MRINNLAKSDINMVADSHIRECNELLRTLIVKLYKRNPRELKKVPGQTVESRLRQIFADPAKLQFAELNLRESTDAMLLAFDDGYTGDRVFALGVGLRSMLYKAYGEQSELYLFGPLEPQKLYNSARNIEIVAWRLAQRRNLRGELFLLTNSTDQPVNLSFERLFGKMIALQDMMATIAADRTKRTINKIVHSIASAVFLPVG